MARRCLSPIARRPTSSLASVKELEGLPVEFRLGEHRVEDFTSADLIVTSPAIPPENEFLVAAKKAGVPITTEIRLFIERCPARIVGVTGTKGKSTTTALLGRMLATKFNVHVGGNIGKSLLLELPKIMSERSRRAGTVQLHAGVSAGGEMVAARRGGDDAGG